MPEPDYQALTVHIRESHGWNPPVMTSDHDLRAYHERSHESPISLRPHEGRHAWDPLPIRVIQGADPWPDDDSGPVEPEEDEEPPTWDEVDLARREWLHAEEQASIAKGDFLGLLARYMGKP